MARKRRRDHTVCKVAAEDRQGHLHRVTLRIPFKVPVSHRNVVRLTENKIGRISKIVEETCTTARRSKSHRLPR